MFKDTPVFSGFSVNDQAAAKKFYGETLGIVVEEDEMGLKLKLAGGADVFVYAKNDHQPATFTILNFVVDNIDETVKQLKSKGVTFEQYDFGSGAKTDENDVMRGIAAGMGPDIAWFKDPASNILAVLQEQ